MVMPKGGFYAIAAGKTGRPECQITRGMIASAALVILNKNYQCIEEKCLSKNDYYVNSV